FHLNEILWELLFIVNRLMKNCQPPTPGCACSFSIDSPVFNHRIWMVTTIAIAINNNLIMNVSTKKSAVDSIVTHRRVRVKILIFNGIVRLSR
ncbi:MAG: hypothetical protein WBB64_12225, partial [Anaerolineales bacterium]